MENYKSSSDGSTDIPEKLFDAANQKTYQRLRFFGKVKKKTYVIDLKLWWKPLQPCAIISS